MLLSQAKELIKTPQNQGAIERGKYHEAWLKFHNSAVIQRGDLSVRYRELCALIDSILPKGKYERWKQLFAVPVGTLELTESIFTHLYKVFSAQDRYIEVQDDDQEFFEYIESFRTFFQTEVWDAVKRSIDSVLVIDLPEVQLTDSPEPYLYVVQASQLDDIDVDSDNNCIYVSFKHAGGYVFICDEYYRLFDENKDFLKEIPHQFGETPARQIWTDRLGDNYINKLSPITKSLGDLDWLLIHKTNKKYLDLGNSFPVTAVYKKNATYEGKDGDKKVENNIGADLMGPGSLVEVTPPMDKDDADLLRNPVQVISPDINSLEYNVKEEVRKTEVIFRSCVGIRLEGDVDQPKNEMQIESGFESQKAVLMKVAKNMEILEQWTYNMMGRIRYSQDYNGVDLSYGSKFFDATVQELSDGLIEAKKTGNIGLIESYSSNIITTKFKGRELQRQLIIKELDPFPLNSIDEVKEMVKDGVVDREDFLMKSQLTNLINRFERENVNVVDFGTQIDFAKRINTIEQTIRGYIKEKQNEKQNESKPE